MLDHPKMSPGDQMMHLAEDNPRTRSAVSNLEILDSPPDWDRVVATYDRLTRMLPRLRQKVVTPSVPTTAPRWVIDADFDIHYHLRRVSLPAPGSLRQLFDAAEVIASTPLDPARPLWTATLFEGLAGGRAAAITHMSHVVGDGVGGIAMAQALYELTPDAVAPPLAPQPSPSDLSPNELAVRGLKQLPGLALHRARFAASSVLGAALHPGRVVSFAKSLGALAATGAKTEPSPLLRRRGLARRIVTIQVDLPALKAAGKRHDGSINDTYVAALTLGLQRYHVAKGVPVETLPLVIPVNMRKADDSMEGNSFTGVMIAAPVAEPDLTARVQSVRDQIKAGRESSVDILGLIAPVMVNLPTPLLEGFSERMSGPDVQASNVASYPVDTWFAGSKVVAQYGLGPLPSVAMMVTMISRAGRCFITARYDQLSFDDDALLATCLVDGFREMIGDPAAVSDADGELSTTATASASLTASPPTKAKKPAQPTKTAAKPAPKPAKAAAKTTQTTKTAQTTTGQTTTAKTASKRSTGTSTSGSARTTGGTTP